MQRQPRGKTAMPRLITIISVLALTIFATTTIAEAGKKSRNKRHQPATTQKLGDMERCDGGVMITAQDQMNGCSRIIASRASRATKSVAHYNRANAQMKLSQVAGAIEDYGRALRLNADFAQAHFNRAIAYQMTGNWNQALTDLDTSVALLPEDADTLAARGQLLLRMGRLGPAMADFERTLVMNPRHVGALTGRAHLHARAQDWKAALAGYDTALQFEPQSADARYARGLVLVWTGKIEQGEAEMLQATAFSPGVAERLAAQGLSRTPTPLATATLTN